MKNLIIIFLAVFTQFCESQSQASYKVVGIKDGDSIEVLDLKNKQTFVVRLAEIDCPEIGQAFGKNAKNFTSAEVFGKTIKLKITGTDRYNRKIARVLYQDKDLSEELLINGLAWVYTQYSTDERLKQLEISARNKRTGLWVDNNSIEPSKFRKRKNNYELF